MADKEFLSELKRGREEEYFRKKEQELIEKMRRDAGGDERPGEPIPEAQTPENVKPEESDPESRSRDILGSRRSWRQRPYSAWSGSG
jgi:hypothetical protein